MVPGQQHTIERAGEGGSVASPDSSADADLTVVAIDGPAGSGKSTVARHLADALDLTYLDTGAMYRSVTHAVLEQGVDPTDDERVAAIARDTSIEFGDDRTVIVDGHDVTSEIRGPDVSRAVSVVAANRGVRAELVARQRAWTRARGGGVLDGRDIGTVVFPNAILKVYLTASESVRATRRARDERTDDTSAVAADLARRDKIDSERPSDPLRQAPDAFLLDTSNLTIDEVVARLVDEIRG